MGYLDLKPNGLPDRSAPIWGSKLTTCWRASYSSEWLFAERVTVTRSPTKHLRAPSRSCSDHDPLPVSATELESGFLSDVCGVDPRCRQIFIRINSATRR